MIICLYIFIFLCIFMIGAFFGSFFSLATYRIPKGEDITHTRSYCPNCKHKLSFFDLFPVISYIVRGGKCKYCKQKISPRYILLESLNGILFVGIYFVVYKVSSDLLVALFVSMIIYIIYAVIFVIIGSKIMENLNKEKENSIDSKKGVYVAELVVAFVAFLIIISSSVVISRNYNIKLNTMKKESDILKFTVSLVEFLKNEDIAYAPAGDYALREDAIKNYYSMLGLEYDESTNLKVNINVKSYKEDQNVEYDVLKIVKITSSYKLDSKNNSYDISNVYEKEYDKTSDKFNEILN